MSKLAMACGSKPVLMSVAAGTCVTVALLGLSSIPYLEFFAFLWLPGALLAALIFAEGIHSNFAIAYMILSALFDVVLYAVLSYFVIQVRMRKRYSGT